MVRVASLNIQGISNYEKRRKLFYYFNQKQVEIVMLQETHTTKNTVKLFKSSWGGRVYYSHGQSNARGVAILLSKKAKIKVKECRKM